MITRLAHWWLRRKGLYVFDPMLPHLILSCYQVAVKKGPDVHVHLLPGTRIVALTCSVVV